MKLTATRLKKSTKPYSYQGQTVYVFHHREDDMVVVSFDKNYSVTIVVPIIELEQGFKPVQPQINKFSNNRAKDNKVYLTLRKVYLENHKVCQMGVKGCRREATTVHHAKGRIGKLLTDIRYFVAACGDCHTWAENNVEAAKEMGVSVGRLTL